MPDTKKTDTKKTENEKIDSKTLANVKYVRDLMHRKDFTPSMLTESDYRLMSSLAGRADPAFCATVGIPTTSSWADLGKALRKQAKGTGAGAGA